MTDELTCWGCGMTADRDRWDGIVCPVCGSLLSDAIRVQGRWDPADLDVRTLRFIEAGPVLGPTATLLLHLLARDLRPDGPDVGWETVDLAYRLGCGHSQRRLRQAIERLARFRVLRYEAVDLVSVRVFLPLDVAL